jgi:hypothetical protein
MSATEALAMEALSLHIFSENFLQYVEFKKISHLIEKVTSSDTEDK